MKPKFLLIILLAVVVATNVWWAQNGASPLHWDSAIHFSESLNAHRIGSHPSETLVHQVLNVSWYYPPFVSYVSALFYGTFGESEATGYGVMTFFLIVLVVSTFALVSFLHDERTAFLCALLLSACPIIIEHSRTFMLDLPLAAIAVLNVYLLMRTDNFRHRGMSVAAGIVFGFGLLTKWTFPLLVAGPLLQMLWNAKRDGVKSTQRRLNIALLVLSCLIVALPWYIGHIVQIATTRLPGAFLHERVGFWDSALYYLLAIPRQTSWPLAIILLVGEVGYVLSYRKQSSMLGIWFAVSYVLISIPSIKRERLSILILVPLIAMAVIGLRNVWQRFPETLRSKHAYAYRSLIGVAVILFILVSLVSPGSRTGRLLATPFLNASIVSVCGPSSERWGERHEQILDSLASDLHLRGKQRANVRIIPDHPHFNRSTFEFYIKLKQLPLEPLGTSGFPLFTDYIVLKSSEIGVDSPEKAREHLTMELLEQSRRDSSLFKQSSSTRLPDGSDAVVIRVEPQTVAGVTNEELKNRLQELAESFVQRYFRSREGYELLVEPGDSIGFTHGQVKALRVKIAKGEFGDFAFNKTGLPVTDVDIEIGGVTVNPRDAVVNRKLQVLSIDRLEVHHFSVSDSSLTTYLRQSVGKDFRINALTLDNDVLSLDGTLLSLGTNISAVIRLSSVGKGNLAFHIEKLQFGVVPLPAWLFNMMTDSYNPIFRSLQIIREVKINALDSGGQR